MTSPTLSLSNSTPRLIARVSEVMIPVKDYPCITIDASCAQAVATFLRNSGSSDNHLRFHELLVTNSSGMLVGQLSMRTTLENLLNPALQPSISTMLTENSKYFSETLEAVEEWFQNELQELVTQPIAQLVVRDNLVVEQSAHILHGLGIMLKNEKSMLPVIQDTVLKGAVRIDDIFTFLGAGLCGLPHER